MAVESDADRSALLADFGEDLTIGGGAVTGVFDNGFTDELEQWVTQPIALVKTTDVTAFSPGASVTRVSDGVGYTIAEKQPDGVGMTILVLQKT